MITAYQIVIIALSLINLAVFIYLANWYLTHRRIVTMASNFAATMSDKGVKARRDKQKDKSMNQNRGLVARSILESVPVIGESIYKRAKSYGVDDDGLFYFITDPEVLKGVAVMIDFAQGLGFNIQEWMKQGQGVKFPKLPGKRSRSKGGSPIPDYMRQKKQ